MTLHPGTSFLEAWFAQSSKIRVNCPLLHHVRLVQAHVTQVLGRGSLFPDLFTRCLLCVVLEFTVSGEPQGMPVHNQRFSSKFPLCKSFMIARSSCIPSSRIAMCLVLFLPPLHNAYSIVCALQSPQTWMWLDWSPGHPVFCDAYLPTSL